jgi:hypothetical protein
MSPSRPAAALRQRAAAALAGALAICACGNPAPMAAAPNPPSTAGAGGSGPITGAGGAGSGPTGGGGGGSIAGSGGATPLAGDLGDCPVFPADNPWNQDISQAPVDPASARYLAAMNAGTTRLHPDFGSNPGYGIPWFRVPASAPVVWAPMRFRYAGESDPGPYPFPQNAPVEGGPGATGDRHVIAVHGQTCKLYEGFACRTDGQGWACDSGAIFDLRSNALRPLGWTSADAAGLPILPGLVRRDEVQRGEITHALRFTVRRSQRAFVAPARHYASDLVDESLPPLGIRVRLKSDFDLGAYTGAAKVVLTALKKYGMFLADNGSDWYFSGESNPAWNDDEIDPLKRVPASAFEVIQLGEIHR